MSVMMVNVVRGGNKRKHPPGRWPFLGVGGMGSSNEPKLERKVERDAGSRENIGIDVVSLRGKEKTLLGRRDRYCISRPFGGEAGMGKSDGKNDQFKTSRAGGYG